MGGEPDDDDDDLDWEEWMDMSEAQQEAILDRETKDYFRMLSLIPAAERQRQLRQSYLNMCLSWRRRLRDWDIDAFRFQLKTCQMALVKIRVWRETGTYPGEA